MSAADTHEPPPIPNDRPALWPLVMEDVRAACSTIDCEFVLPDMRARHEADIAKYGTPLQPFNGRNALVDAYQEALDGVVYLRQAVEEAKTRPGIEWAMLHALYMQMLRLAIDIRRRIP